MLCRTWSTPLASSISVKSESSPWKANGSTGCEVGAGLLGLGFGGWVWDLGVVGAVVVCLFVLFVLVLFCFFCFCFVRNPKTIRDKMLLLSAD